MNLTNRRLAWRSKKNICLQTSTFDAAIGYFKLCSSAQFGILMLSIIPFVHNSSEFNLKRLDYLSMQPAGWHNLADQQGKTYLIRHSRGPCGVGLNSVNVQGGTAGCFEILL